MTGHFSDVLMEHMQAVLKAGKQVILFQNRRGYSPVLECKTCGHTPQCPHCDVSLTVHKYSNQLDDQNLVPFFNGKLFEYHLRSNLFPRIT